MDKGSTVEGRTALEREKAIYRFGGDRGQNQGAAKSGPNHFVPESLGLYAYPVSNSKAKE